MNEVGAVFDGDPEAAVGEDAAADPVPGFQHDHLSTGLGKVGGSGKTRHSSPHHDDLQPLAGTGAGRRRTAWGQR